MNIAVVVSSEFDFRLYIFICDKYAENHPSLHCLLKPVWKLIPWAAPRSNVYISVILYFKCVLTFALSTQSAMNAETL